MDFVLNTINSVAFVTVNSFYCHMMMSADQGDDMEKCEARILTRMGFEPTTFGRHPIYLESTALPLRHQALAPLTTGDTFSTISSLSAARNE